MHRRDLLKGASALALQPVLSPFLPAWAAANAVSARRVRPSDPAWPSAASWAKLKDDVGGNLIEVHSLFGSCETEPNGAACLDAHKNIGNPFWIGDQPAGTQVSGWLDAWTPAPSAYAVKARNAADVAAGVDFARENNLRLVVKGDGPLLSGHIQRAGLAARLDTRDEPGDAARRLRRPRLRRPRGAGSRGQRRSGCGVDGPL